MTDPIVAFITAHLDRVEQATIRYRDGHDGPCVNYDDQDPAGYDQYDSCSRHIAAAEATPYRDPDFGLRQVAALRRILNVALGWQHFYFDDDTYYSCGLAVAPDDPNREPGSGCCNDDKGERCTCAVESRRTLILGPLAAMFEGGDGWNPDWKVTT